MLMPESLERAGEIGSRPPVCTQNTSKKKMKGKVKQVKSKAEFYIALDSCWISGVALGVVEGLVL